MKYRVVIHPDAEKELKGAYAWLWAQSPEAAERWRKGLLRKAATLARFPERCPLASEAEKLGSRCDNSCTAGGRPRDTGSSSWWKARPCDCQVWSPRLPGHPAAGQATRQMVSAR